MNRILRATRQLGLLNACLLGLGRVLAQLSRQRWRLYRYLFVAQQLPPHPLCLGRGRDIHLRKLTQRTGVPPGCPRPEAVILSRYRAGARGVAAYRKGKLAGFIWFVSGRYQEDEVRAEYILPSAASVWDFDVWVHADERLGWTFRRLWDAARLLMRARGARYSCSRISAFNPASLRAHAAIGTTALGSATFLCCGSWQWMVATIPPYLHLSRTQEARPRLTIRPKEH